MGRHFEVGGRSGELHEGGGLARLDFEGLQIGDTILLETSSGSSYQLHVKVNDTKTMVKVDRRSQHDVMEDEENSWENLESDTLFELRGSCERSLEIAGSGLSIVDGTEGTLLAGQRAWLGTELEGKDRTLITGAIESLNLIPAI